MAQNETSGTKVWYLEMFARDELKPLPLPGNAGVVRAEIPFPELNRFFTVKPDETTNGPIVSIGLICIGGNTLSVRISKPGCCCSKELPRVTLNWTVRQMT